MSEVEKKRGVLKIKPTKKKGFHAVFVREDGKEIPLSQWEFSDDALNGMECELEMQGGAPKEIYINGEIFPKRRVGTENHRNKVEAGGRHRQGEVAVANNMGGRNPRNQYIDLWKIDNTQLPKDTRALIQRQEEIENYALMLNKAAQLIEDNGKEPNESFKLFVRERPTRGQKGRKLCAEPYGYGGFDFKELLKRLDYLRTLAEGYKVIEVGEMKPEWRMIVGLGGGNVYETSITLHHIYGFPYIPGSAVKGITRSHIVDTLLYPIFPEEGLSVIDAVIDLTSDGGWRGARPLGLSVIDAVIDLTDLDALREKCRNGENDEALKKLRKSLERDEGGPGEDLLLKVLEGWDELDRVREVFGNQARRGKVVFLDAYPVKGPTIKTDIMNPHFLKYYSEGSPPVDSMSPVPIHFLTVEDTPFRFFIMAEERHSDVLDEPIGGKVMAEWVRSALKEHGIGAKTSVGYGYMK